MVVNTVAIDEIVGAAGCRFGIRVLWPLADVVMMDSVTMFTCPCEGWIALEGRIANLCM